MEASVKNRIKPQETKWEQTNMEERRQQLHF